MPFYQTTLTVPANTPAKSPVEKVWELTKGIIHRLEIQFLPGCMGMVQVQILHGRMQIWPTGLGEAFSGEDNTIAFDDFYPLLSAPYALTLRGWSPGTSYDHTIRFRVGILPEDVAAPHLPMKRIQEILEEWLGLRK